MKEKTGMMPPVVGISSLLVIFAVLCLVVFALLSLATVQADIRLADKAEQAVVGYYRADSQAETILAKLRAGEIPAQVELTDGVYMYGCPISDTQILWVEISEDTHEILRWQAVSTTDWQASDKRPVWDGKSGEE